MRKCIFYMMLIMLLVVGRSAFANTNQLAAEVFLGESYNYLNPGNLVFLGGEIDKLVPNDSNHHDFSPGFGFTYTVPVNVRCLDSLRFAVDVIWLNRKQQGVVQQFMDPQFDNYFYTLKVDTTRLMFNGQLVFASWWNKIFPFIELGVGGAHMATSYNEQPNISEGIVSGHLKLASHIQYNFVYAGGAGFIIPVTKHFNTTLAYQFTDFGHIRTENFSGVQQVHFEPIDARFYANTVYLKFSYLFN